MSETKTYKVAFDDSSYGTVELTKIGEKTYRLEDTPIFLAEELSNGDIIEVSENDADILQFVKVIEKTKLKRTNWVLSQFAAESNELANLKEKIINNGGNWDHYMVGVFIVYLPESSEIDIEKEIKYISKAAKR